MQYGGRAALSAPPAPIAPEPDSHGVLAMSLKILGVSNVMIRITFLPDLPLHRDFDRGREQQMNMVGHSDKLMQQIFPLIAIPK